MIQVEVITPQKKLFSVSCESVVLPGLLGEMEVLKGHRPLLTMLQTGVLTLKGLQASSGLAYDRLMVSLGFAQVEPNHVRVLCEEAAIPSEVDAKRDQEQLQKLHTQMQTPQDADIKELTVQIERATARLQLVGHI